MYMPIYEFMNKESGLIEDHLVKIADVEQFLLDNPLLTKTMTTAPSIGDPVRLGVRKQDGGWREVLTKVSERTPGGKGLKDNIR